MNDVISLKKNKFEYVVIASFIFQILNIFLICGAFAKIKPTVFYIDQKIYVYTNFFLHYIINDIIIWFFKARGIH